MIKEFENIKKQIATQKKRKEDFFWQMENRKISYFTKRIFISYLIMSICFFVVYAMFIVGDIKENFDTAILVTIIVFIILTLVALLYFVFFIFLKNSLQFKLGKLSSGLISWAILVVPIYIVLLLCYIFVPQGKEIIISFLTAVTSISAAILAMMGVHYTLVQHKNEKIEKNNLLFELYEKFDSETKYSVKNALGEVDLQIRIKNISNNFGYLIGLYKLCGCNVYQVGDKFSYIAIQPNNYLLIAEVRINSGDDQLILVYRDIGENYYYLLLSINDNKISNIERAGKCDFDFLKDQIVETDEAEKAVNSKNKKIKIVEIKNQQNEMIDINRRKEETKPNRVENFDGFEVIVSKDGELITDRALLNDLRKERLKLAKENKIKAYMILNNQQLVALATYKPTDEMSFISIYGLGKKKYDLYGELFIQIIKKYNEGKTAA